MKGYCYYCDNVNEFNLVQKKSTYTIQGEEITIDASVAVCPYCNEENIFPKVCEDNYIKALEIYRARTGYRDKPHFHGL